MIYFFKLITNSHMQCDHSVKMLPNLLGEVMGLWKKSRNKLIPESRCYQI